MIYTQVTQLHAQHQHAQQWSSRNRIRLIRFRPETLADFWSHPVLAGFLECSRSIVMSCHSQSPNLMLAAAAPFSNSAWPV